MSYSFSCAGCQSTEHIAALMVHSLLQQSYRSALILTSQEPKDACGPSQKVMPFTSR
ncbi:Hypothetical predicted protein [Podarcis lilfordi]|uniref:Uncharacterized protein n=1 Tax=Podarcis lilfordi TaxID=74358 RepID=A0AA35P6Y4_9SAUR|nr:Hypothetical predicted protein [Podarcis lilfordi]